MNFLMSHKLRTLCKVPPSMYSSKVCCQHGFSDIEEDTKEAGKPFHILFIDRVSPQCAFFDAGSGEVTREVSHIHRASHQYEASDVQ